MESLEKRTKNGIVLLDMDDFILDRGDSIYMLTHCALEQLGYNVNLQEIKSEICKLGCHIEYIKTLGLTDVDAYWQEHNGWEDRIKFVREGIMKYYPGTEEFLTLRENFGTCVTSNTPIDIAQPMAEEIGLVNLVDNCVFHDIEKYGRNGGKPNTTIAHEAMGRLGFDSREIVIYTGGNAPTDVIAGDRLRAEGYNVVTFYLNHDGANGVKADIMPASLVDLKQKIIEHHRRSIN